MTLAWIHSLAKGDPIIGIIFFVIWGIIVVLSGLQKYQQKQRKQQQMQLPPPQQPPTVPPPQAPHPQAQTRPAPRMQPKPTYKPSPVAAKPKAAPPLARKILSLPKLTLRKVPPQPPRPAPPLPAKPATAPEPAILIQEDAYEIHSTTSARLMQAEIGAGGGVPKHIETPPAISSRRLSQILRPASLRQYYILAEVLREPVGLREQSK